MYKNIHGPDGKLLFKYDPTRNLISIKRDGLGWVLVDLQQYQQQSTQDQAEVGTVSEECR